MQTCCHQASPLQWRMWATLLNVNGFQAPCLGWGQLQSKRGDPWYGRPARYATRQTTVCSPLTFPKTPQDTYHPPTYTSKKTPLPHDVNASTQQLVSPPSLPESGCWWPAWTQPWARATTQEQTWMTHQHTNNGDNDVLGGHCQAALSAQPS